MRRRNGAIETTCVLLAGPGAFVVLMAFASSAFAQDAKQKLFERIFGDAARLDPAMVAKVKATKPGERTFVDRNKDGKNDEVWYIDTSVRHQDKSRPLLVRAIDEDGDLDEHKGPDLDSDLYVADWKADGTVDVVLDYQDNDADNDVDEMGMYYFVPKYRYLDDKPGLLVWWGRDLGDDNLLWYDVNLTYQQPDCQYRSHFSGEEVFVQFGLTEDAKQWSSIFENPFAFYDPDGDRCSEVVIRLTGRGDVVDAVRYSFDADDDAFGRRTHDYDFSITALARGTYLKDLAAPEIRYPEAITADMKLRGIPTQRWIQVEHACKFAEDAPWSCSLLTWDEMNANTEENVARDPNERWEGIINHDSKSFVQVGGPPCSALNKRNEISRKPPRPMRLYYDPTDRRLHLKGANEGWLHVDVNFDGTADAKYTYIDDDHDGIFDRRQIDVDADGKVEFDWKMKGQGAREIPLEFQALSSFYRPVLLEVLADSQEFIDVANAVLAAKAGKVSLDPVESFFVSKLESWYPATKLGLNMRKTPSGARLYVDLLRDRLLAGLKKSFADHEAWMKIELLYSAGDYRSAAQVVAKELPGAANMPNPKYLGSFAGRIPVTFDNSGGPQRDDWPMTIPVKDLKAVATRFDAARCLVVAPDRWIYWRLVPHQVDRINPAVGQELSFLVDLRKDSSSTYYIYYQPMGGVVRTFDANTDTAEDWVPPNIGWESNRVAYRAYWGQFDFFGKKVDQLIYPTIGKKSYHDEVDWGIDALNSEATSGCGGLTLYVDDKAFLVQNPKGKGDVQFTKRQVAKGPVRAVVEIEAANVVPSKPDLKVRMQCLIYAERQETEIRAAVSGADGESVLAPGFIKLARDEVFGDPDSGCFGVWGWQTPVIDEIGMALIVPPDAYVDWEDLPAERKVKLRTTGGKLRYWLNCDWRRGRQHPIAPTIRNWENEMHGLAGLLLNDVKFKIGQDEKVR